MERCQEIPVSSTWAQKMFKYREILLYIVKQAYRHITILQVTYHYHYRYLLLLLLLLLSLVYNNNNNNKINIVIHLS